MKYIRLYSDENGESHTEEWRIDFNSVDFAPPAPPLEIAQLGAAQSIFLIRSATDWTGEWHPAPFRQLHFYLAGEVEVETSDGQVQRVSAGDIALVEDTVGRGHRSRAVGPVAPVIAAAKLP